jgi:hypothetical protein
MVPSVFNEVPFEYLTLHSLPRRGINVEKKIIILTIDTNHIAVIEADTSGED